MLPAALAAELDAPALRERPPEQAMALQPVLGIDMPRFRAAAAERPWTAAEDF
jgi:hypothetical protein